MLQRKPMPSSHVNDAQHWRERAAHMRALSLMMRDVEAQAIMQQLANDYDKLADGAVTRAAAQSPIPPNRSQRERSPLMAPHLSSEQGFLKLKATETY